MNILLAPDSFKGTLSSDEVCNIIESVLKSELSDANITKLPVADGGEGLCSSLLFAIGGKTVSVKTKNPLNEDIEAEYIFLNNDTAIIEMSSCAGLPLIEDRKDPLKASTFGVGIMIRDAVSKGANNVVLGLGGSATNDCGMGMAAALGYEFLDDNGNNVVPCGENMLNVSHIKVPEKLPDIKITAACDVDNPLYGENGAAYVFAPQKGADMPAVELLDAGLKNIASVISRDIGEDTANIPGAGAAGGMGAGVKAFLNASLKRGIDIVLDIIDFNKLLKSADLVITGEGRLDSQTACGKVISGICSRTELYSVPTVAVCGCVEENVSISDLGLSRVYVCSKDGLPFDEVKRNCRSKLKTATRQLALDIKNNFYLLYKGETANEI